MTEPFLKKIHMIKVKDPNYLNTLISLVPGKNYDEKFSFLFIGGFMFSVPNLINSISRQGYVPHLVFRMDNTFTSCLFKIGTKEDVNLEIGINNKGPYLLISSIPLNSSLLFDFQDDTESYGSLLGFIPMVKLRDFCMNILYSVGEKSNLILLFDEEILNKLYPFPYHIVDVHYISDEELKIVYYIKSSQQLFSFHTNRLEITDDFITLLNPHEGNKEIITSLKNLEFYSSKEH